MKSSAYLSNPIPDSTLAHSRPEAHNSPVVKASPVGERPAMTRIQLSQRTSGELNPRSYPQRRTINNHPVAPQSPNRHEHQRNQSISTGVLRGLRLVSKKLVILSVSMGTMIPVGAVGWFRLGEGFGG